ncbi:MAG: DNA polymerase IV [Clostridium sp.]|nr:DNA polymerase IV [Clostridium sp.]
MRKIIHIDMDAFFAAVEQRENPSLRGKPIAVGYDGSRSVVCTASYEARPYGVHSAMPMAKAKKLCPQLIVVPCHFALYKEISRQVHEIFLEYTDLVEPISIDEAFLDVTENKPGIALAQDIAREIKRKIWERTGLTASAGISYNKFLAKIASDYRKPNGMFTVHPQRALDFIAALPIEDFWGVGPKTAEKMHALGISTGLQLRRKSLEYLLQFFGKQGAVYYDFARGVDNRPVVTERVRKSVGCEETYLTDIYKPLDIEEALQSLVIDLRVRLQKAQFQGRTFTVKVKFYDFEQITRSVSAEEFIDTSEAALMAMSRAILDGVEYNKERPIRLLGLSVSNPELHTASQAEINPYPTIRDLDDYAEFIV